MNNSKPDDRLSTTPLITWAMRTHTELQLTADELWDALDTLQSKEEFEATLEAYNEICDTIILLEASPECVRTGHLADLVEWLTTTEGRVSCSRCGAVIAYDF